LDFRLPGLDAAISEFIAPNGTVLFFIPDNKQGDRAAFHLAYRVMWGVGERSHREGVRYAAARRRPGPASCAGQWSFRRGARSAKPHGRAQPAERSREAVRKVAATGENGKVETLLPLVPRLVLFSLEHCREEP